MGFRIASMGGICLIERRKHILIIGGRDTSVEMLESLPIDITLFQTAERVTLTQYRVATRVIISKFDDQEEVIKLAKAVYQYFPFDAVVSFLKYICLLRLKSQKHLEFLATPCGLWS